ncbi:MAG: hypothetical protein WBC18_25430 [Ottowia sp.]|uniref:hypothetical protein n=1 Tax=unclassified Ottowia TaxID=2645081 RepID=UPI003C2B2149
MRISRSLYSAWSLAVLACAVHPIAYAGPVNESGAGFHRSHLNGGDLPIRAPGPDQHSQDAGYGRDAAVLAGVLPKARSAHEAKEGQEIVAAPDAGEGSLMILGLLAAGLGLWSVRRKD